jgi:hypothetical protein
MSTFWLLLTAVALVLAYALIVRPILHKIPALKAFYDEADTVWAKVWALAWNSLTVAWSYLMAAVGAVMQGIDTIGSALGDPGLKDQITQTLGSDPKVLGYILLSISTVTLLARLRSISKPTA